MRKVNKEKRYYNGNQLGTVLGNYYKGILSWIGFAMNVI